MYNYFWILVAGTIFKAHKLILAACSKNFADLFETAPANGSVCVILEATSAENMSALLEFMYKGEVHVSQKALESFLKAAESLQVSVRWEIQYLVNLFMKTIPHLGQRTDNRAWTVSKFDSSPRQSSYRSPRNK